MNNDSIEKLWIMAANPQGQLAGREAMAGALIMDALNHIKQLRARVAELETQLAESRDSRTLQAEKHRKCSKKCHEYLKEIERLKHLKAAPQQEQEGESRE